jgi:cytochrome c-type biogenesis protein CcmE
MPSLRILLVVGTVLAGLLYLIVSGLGANAQQYVTITELTHLAAAAPDTVYKLKGKIVDGSVSYDPNGPALRFALEEGAGSPVIQVESAELMPDNFKAGNECIVEGTFDRAAARFTATKVMTKCPSKYEAAETEDEPRASQP